MAIDGENGVRCYNPGFNRHTGTLSSIDQVDTFYHNGELTTVTAFTSSGEVKSWFPDRIDSSLVGQNFRYWVSGGEKCEDGQVRHSYCMSFGSEEEPNSPFLRRQTPSGKFFKFCEKHTRLPDTD
jgi:hypothetical protein